MAENIDEITDARRADAERKNQTLETAQAVLSKAITEGRVEPSDIDRGRYVGFAAPVEKNTRILIQAGKPLTFPDKDSPRGQKMVEREGDVWIEFHDGLIVLDSEDADDRARIAWCAEHPQICRDVNDPLTEAWTVLKEGQSPLAWRDPVIPTSLDVDAALRGDPKGYSRPDSQAARARKHLAEQNAVPA